MTWPWGWRWRSARLARQLPAQSAGATCGDLLEEFNTRLTRASRWRAEWWLTTEMSSLGRAYRADRAALRASMGVLLSGLGRNGAYAVRALRHAPWYVVTAVGVVAVSVSLATAVFAIVDGTLFKPLPYPEAGRVFAVALGHSQLAEPFRVLAQVPEATAVEWREAVPDIPFTTFDAYGTHTVGYHDVVGSAAIDATFFDVVGQRPLVGGFAPGDFETDQLIAPALISYAFWQERLGGASNVVGRTLVGEEGHGIRIVGILPADFLFPAVTPLERRPQLLVPRMTHRPASRDLVEVMVRVGPFQAVGDVSARLATVLARQVAARPAPLLDSTASPRLRAAMAGYDRIRLDPIREALTGTYLDGAWALFAASAALVLLACLNVAGLAIARVRDRQLDLVVRRALGARTTDLIALLGVENALLVAAGTGLGVLTARGVLVEITPYLTNFMAVLKAPAIDLRVLAFAVFGAAGCASLVTLLSARAVAHASLRTPMSQGGGTTARLRGQSWLVAIEVALGLVLVVGGALVTGSLMRAWAEDPGFNARDTALVSVVTPTGWSAEQVEVFITTLSRLPGVVQAGGASHSFLEHETNGNAFKRPAGVPLTPIDTVPITHGFIQAAGLPLLEGRLPTDTEFATNASVIVVSETTAHEYWPGQSAIGQSLVQGGEGRSFAVVGVVGDARYISLDRAVQGVIYAPISSHPHPSVSKVLVRFAHADARSLEPVVSDIVASCPGCWLSGAEMLRDALSMSISGREFSAMLFAGFGAAALVIVGTAALGVVAMSTHRRTREIGVRMALGATGGDVMWQIVWEQVWPVVVGLACGAAVAAWATRFVTTYLYKTPTYDASSWLFAIVALLVIAFTGALVPSLRASHIDPVQALRVE